MTLQKTFERAWSAVTARASVLVQEKEELWVLVALLNANRVCSYLELGASEGVSLEVVGATLPVCSKIVVVDLFEEHSAMALHGACDRLRDMGHTVGVCASSTAAARASLQGQRFDAILIDAGHSYEDVKADWEAYKDMGRIIVFHDIGLPSMRKLWEEIGGGLEIRVTPGTGQTKGHENMGFGVVVR